MLEGRGEKSWPGWPGATSSHSWVFSPGWRKVATEAKGGNWSFASALSAAVDGQQQDLNPASAWMPTETVHRIWCVCVSL